LRLQGLQGRTLRPEGADDQPIGDVDHRVHGRPVLMLGGESSVERLNENAHVGPSVRRGMAAIHRGMAAIHRGMALIRRNTASIRRGTAPAYPSPGSTTWKHVVRAV